MSQSLSLVPPLRSTILASTPLTTAEAERSLAEFLVGFKERSGEMESGLLSRLVMGLGEDKQSEEKVAARK
jgi:hypothetical protein